MFGVKEIFNFDVSIDRIDPLKKEEIFKKYKQRIDSYLDNYAREVFKETLLTINTLLERKFNTNLIETTLSYEEKGAPNLSNGLNLSYSHTENFVYVAISSKYVIGCDIETPKYRDYQGIAHRFYDEEEYFCLKNTSPNRVADVFYKFWTTKEAYLKSLKVGLYKTLDSFKIIKFKKIVDKDNPDINVKIRTRKDKGFYTSLVVIK